jgi:DNA-binding IclR family transcriptional regulator
MPASESAEKKNAAAAGVKSAGRVLSIFEYFEKKRAPRTLSEISMDLDYPVSSTLALLRSIQTMGYLNYDHENKAYFPSIRFAMMGQWIHDRLFEGGPFVQMIENLAARTRETALLGIQNGLQAQHIHIVSTPQSLSYHPVVGTLRPLLRSASGRVLLSLQPEATVRKTVERINALGIDDGIVFDASEVLADVEKVRSDGFAYSANNFVQGAAIISIALPVRTGDVPMALSVGGPVSRIEGSIYDVLKQLHAVADEFIAKAGEL